jgi:hypothetical protein
MMSGNLCYTVYYNYTTYRQMSGLILVMGLRGTHAVHSRLLFPLLLTLLFCVSALVRSDMPTPPSEPQDSLRHSFDTILRRVAAIRHLEAVRPIKRAVRNRSQIRDQLRALLDAELPSDAWERERQAMHAWGVLPADFPLRTFVLDLLTEQAAGYYDPGHETFFIANWLPLELQRPIIAHELVHALQDQHYDLQRHFSPLQEHADLTLARQALLEGDAMAVMFAYMLQPLGMRLEQMPELESLLQTESTWLGGQFQVFEGAPAILKQQLLFPYIYGLRFVKTALSRHGWDALRDLYAHPPTSTEQVLHPEKYFTKTPDRPQPIALRLPERLQDAWRKRKRDVLGEFLLSVVLRQFLPEPEAKQSAAGWRGDRYELFVHQASERLALVCLTAWDNPAEAEEFFHSYAKLLQLKYAGWKLVSRQQPTDLLWQHGAFRVMLRRRAHMVQIIEQVPATLLPQLRHRLDEITDRETSRQDAEPW